MSYPLYADQDGTASEISQAQYSDHIGSVTAAIQMLSWLGLAVSVASSSSTSSHTLWSLVACHSTTLGTNPEPVSVYQAGLRSAVLTLSILMHQMYANVVAKAFFQCPALLLMAATLVAISLSIQRKPYLITDHAILVDAENSSSVLSRCFMTWSRDSMRIASEMSKLDALPVLNHKTRSKNQPSLRDSTQDLMTQVLVQRIHVIVRQWSLTILRTTLTFGCPYCVLRLIACVESNDLDLAWVWLCGTVLFATCETVVHYHQNWIQWSELGIPIRAQLMTATYQKLLRTEGDEHMNDTQAKLGSPTVNTLLTSDATIVSKFSAIHYILPLSMLKLAIALMFIQRLLGWRGMSTALIITMTSMPINMLVVSKRKLAQKKLRKARDQKDKAIGEMIKTLHHIKLQGNEELWKQRVRICRSNELCAERQDLHAQNISLIWKIASPLLVSSVSIFVNAYFEGQITASVIFTILELLPQLQGTLGLAPLVIQDYLSARASSRRIESFLGSPDRDDYVQANDAGHIAFRDATFMWSDSRSKSVPAVQDIGPAFRLERVSICFPARHLSIIHGTTGSGKSLMLAAILGEAKLLKGVIEAPRAASGCPVAIVTQTPWLQSTTIKENILFGENYDASRYNSVLEACALIQDLQAFQYGDRTTIGAQGVKVSGGQHARISLARALYSRATTILLDDILSALDSRVARHVLDALDGPLGTGRTRILVTHQLELCIPKASYVVHISNGTARGSAQSLTNNHQARSLGLDEASQDTISRRTSYAAEQILGSDAHIDKRQKLTKSTRDVAVKDSPMAPFQLYIGALGGSSFVTIFCVALIIRQVLVILPTWTLKNIKVLGEGAASQDSTVDGIVCHVSLFVACSVLAVLAEYLFHAHQASGTLRASEILFNTMLDTVIQMPLTWIDGVPTGDLTQRFCTDLQAMDDRLMPLVSEFLQCAIEMMTIIVIGLNQSLYTSFMALAGLYASFLVGRLYNKARKTVQRADRQPTSQMLGLVAATTAGLSTIRAFGATIAFEERMHSCVDDLSKARRHFWIANRWLGLQMSLIGIMFSFGTGVVLLHLRPTAIDASLFGFALTFSMRFSNVVFKAVNGFGTLETAIVATGAIAEFKFLETEDQNGIETTSGWPLSGRVEIRGLSLKYSDTSPLVLDDINLTIAPGERIGIVGRTGAGKSTLLLALLRIVQSEKGIVLIDAIDTSTIRLCDMRQKIGYIPQNPALFSGTIRTNLDSSNRYSDATLQEVLQRVGLMSNTQVQLYVNPQTLTLDSPVAVGGENISHGQRQLLCLARIFLHKHRLILLDETTSAIDDRSDAAIQRIVQSDSTQTLIVVAHRLKTVATFDKIIVMDGGRIIEQGSPKELFESLGAYYRLVTSS